MIEPDSDRIWTGPTTPQRWLHYIPSPMNIDILLYFGYTPDRGRKGYDKLGWSDNESPTQEWLFRSRSVARKRSRTGQFAGRNLYFCSIPRTS